MKLLDLNKIFRLALVAGFIIITSCAKVGVPISPDKLAPSAIRDLQVSCSAAAVKFSWKAPETDAAGKQLKTIEGYQISRKPITKESDIGDPDIEFEKLALVGDTHLEELKKLKDESLLAGKPTKKIKQDPAKSAFEYSDLSVVAGKTYLFQITPVNQGGTEGQVANFIRVVFRGGASEINLLTSGQLDSES